MKVIKVTKPFTIEIAEMEQPTITATTDVIIRITSGGICGSDMQIYNGSNSLATYPRIIGHEFGGIVTEVGADVTTVQIGDKVAVDPVISCGTCYACQTGRHNVCSTLEVMGVHRDGGFSEYVKLPVDNVYLLPETLDDSLLSLVEPYSIGMQINDRARITGDDKVLIMGAGPIGICIMQVAKSRGAQVIMTDVIPQRLEKAKKMGADVTVLTSEENLEEKLAAFTNNAGIPVVIDTVCIPATFSQSVQLACPSGRVLVIGLKAAPTDIVMADITKKELDILGSRLSNYCFPSVIEGFASGALTPESLKTAEFNFTEAEKAFKYIAENPQDILKVVLRF